MISKLKLLLKNNWFIIAVSLFLLVAFIIAIFFLFGDKVPVEGNIVLEEIKDIKVSEAEMKEYRDKIGTDMDVKKSYLILFEDEESCRSFIETHGAEDDPTAAGIGIIPMMEDGYYNIVGKQSLEDAFDLLKDGEYSKEPVIYSNMYCYLKRICIESPINNDEALKEFIQKEKYQELKKAGD